MYKRLTNEGRLLVFPLSELPELPKGKGNKIIAIPSAKAANREEYVIDVKVLNENNSLEIQSGKRELTLKPKDLQNYHGERGRRGQKLPRGFVRAEKMAVV